jgi:pectate lyase
LNLPAGKHVLKVVADSQLFRMNAISVLDAGSGPGGGGGMPDLNACANPSSGYEGFGRNTTGGAGQPVYRVTNLNDSGSGSLRDALSRGNRCVVFDVGGTISLSSNLMVKGANVTIDGLTAPSPGITLKGRTLVMQGSSGAGNIVVRGIRSRGTPSGEDAIRVYNASNIVIDRVSVSGFGDGAVDVTEKARDVTIQWSILGNGNPSHNFSNLIGYDASRVTVHHNLYLNSDDRNPYCGRNGASSLSPETVCDVRNNLIWNYVRGTAVRAYGTANVVNNYYYTKKDTSAARTVFLDTGASAHVSGNISKNGWNVNGNGNRSSPFAAIAPATTDALTAAKQVVAQAGARGPRFGLDAADQAYIGSISLQ